MTTSVLPKEKISKRKTIVYQTLVDPTVVKVAAEKLKNKLFTRLGFLNPNPEEVQFVSVEKYYEPYIVIGGKYTIDYFRRCIYTVNVEEKVREVILANQKFEPERAKVSFSKGHKIVKLEGEERLLYEDESYFTLDKSGHEVTAEKLPSAPSEKHPQKVLRARSKLGEKVEKIEISPGADVDMIRDRIVNRPRDVKRVVHELFEVNERALIYVPLYRVSFKNRKTGEVKIIEFDGVTSKRIQRAPAFELSLAVSIQGKPYQSVIQVPTR